MPATPFKRPLDSLEPGGDTEEAKADRRRYFAERGANTSQVSGGEPITISPDNYVVDQTGAKDYYGQRQKEVESRQGVRADYSKADAALAQALASRARQQEGAQMFGAAALGLTPSAAQEQMRMALDAQTQQAARMGGARAIAATTPAFGQTGAQGAMGRQQESQAGYKGAAQSLYSMRTGDLQTLRGSQDAAFAQAQLEAAQRARNDELARAYGAEGTNLSLEQLGADQAYTAQFNNNVLRAGGMAENRRKAAQEADQRLGSMIVGAGGALLSGGAKYAGGK
jgi:hypothetical protein